MQDTSDEEERIDAEGRPVDAPQLVRFEQILTAGAALFDQSGFSRTLTEDIAAEAGITKRTLYRYVGSKQLLLFAVCSQLSREFRRIAEVLPTPGSDAVAVVRQMVTEVAGVVLRMHRVTLVYLSERKHFTPAQTQFVIDSEDALVGALSDALRELIGPEDSEIVARGVFGSLLHMSRWYRPTGALSIDLLAETAAGLWIDGVFGVSAVGGYNAGEVRAPASAPDLSAVVLPDWDPTNETQHRILDIATQMFADAGFDSTSTRNLAESASLTKGSLHYYIERKENLLLQIHFRVMAASVQALVDVAERSLRPEEEVAEVIRLHLNNVLRHHSAIVVFNEESKALGGEGMDQIAQWRTQYSRSLEATIAALLDARGVTLPAMQVRVVNLLLLGMLNSVYRWFGGDGEQHVTMVSSVLTRLFLHGVVRSPSAGA